MAEVDLEKMTATELRDFALQHHPDLTGVHAMKKEDLLEAIRKARGEAVPEKEKKKTAGKKKADKKELKKKIRLLKTERQKPLEQKDKKALSRMRKKIKRLKRLTQKTAA